MTPGRRPEKFQRRKDDFERFRKTNIIAEKLRRLFGCCWILAYENTDLLQISFDGITEEMARAILKAAAQCGAIKFLQSEAENEPNAL